MDNLSRIRKKNSEYRFTFYAMRSPKQLAKVTTCFVPGIRPVTLSLSLSLSLSVLTAIFQVNLG